MKSSDLYETPDNIFLDLDLKYGPFDLDVCATKKTAKCRKYFDLARGQNALLLPWHKSGKRIWMNPPYSNVTPWLKKAYEESLHGIEITCLLHSDTSTNWFHSFLYNKKNVKLEFLKGRVRFLYNGKVASSPKFGSVVAHFSGK